MRLRRLRRRVRKAPTLKQIRGLWTYRDIGKAVGLPPTHVYAILNGRVEPRLRSAVRISRFLNIRTEDLCDYLDGLVVLGVERRGRKPGTWKAHERPSGLDPTVATR